MEKKVYLTPAARALDCIWEGGFCDSVISASTEDLGNITDMDWEN